MKNLCGLMKKTFSSSDSEQARPPLNRRSIPMTERGARKVAVFAASSTLYLSKDGRPLCAFSHLKDDVTRSNRFPVITPGAGNRGGR